MEKDNKNENLINIDGSVNDSSIIVGNDNVVKNKTITQNFYHAVTTVISDLSLKQQIWIILSSVIVVVISGYILWSQYLQYDTSYMGKDLNIVVEPFLEERNGHFYQSDDGMLLAQYLYSELETELQGGSFESETGVSIELRGPQKTPPLRDVFFNSPELSAQKIAEKINAHIVLYGVISYDQLGRPYVSVNFFISPDRFRDAQEILGENELGNPILLTGNIQSGTDFEGENEELRNRVQVASLTMKAIGAYSGEDFSLSLDYLNKAIDSSLWKQTTGMETIYLLMGNVLSRQALPALLNEGDEIALNIIQQAEEQYKKALAVASNKGDYARAYVGLAGIENFYAVYKARLSNDYADVDLVALDSEDDYLDKALTASYQSETADIEEKVAFTRAQVYFLRYYLTEDLSFLVGAQANYEQVISSYEQGNVRVRELAAHSYSGVAIVMRSYPQPDYDAIIGFYLKAFETTRTPSLQAMYLTHLGNVYYEIENCEEAVRYYKNALVMEGDLDKRITENQISIIQNRVTECETEISVSK